MARYKDFLQDEDKPFGVGTFVLEDGTEHYLDDPERARGVLDEITGPSSFAGDVGTEATNIAERGSVDRHGEELSKRQLLENAAAKLAGTSEPNEPFRGIDTGPDPMRRAVAGPGGGDEDGESLMSRADDQTHLAPTESRQPEPPSREQMENTVAAQNLAHAYSLVPRAKGGTDPRTLGPGVAVDKSYNREGGLSPDEYNRQAQDRQSAYDATNQTVARHYQENQAAAAAQAEQLRAQALELKQKNDAQEHDLVRKQAQYQDDRAWLEKDVDDYYDKKPDPDGGLRKERGVAGNIGSAIAQFMGAYAAIVSGTPNFANQILNRKIDEHVNAQVEEFRRGRMKRDGQMQRMAERGMSLEQMKSALKLQQELAVQKEVKAAALSEGSREAKQAAESLLMDRQERFTTEENKFRTEALGKQTVSGEFVRPTGPKALSPLERMQEANKILEARVQGDYLARGGAPAERAEERDIKRGETEGRTKDDKGKAVTAYADKVAKEAAPLQKVSRAIDRLEAISKQNKGLPGVGGLSYKGIPGTDHRKLAEEVEQLQQTIVNSLIQANPGSASEGDAQRLAVEAFGKGTQESALDGMANARQFIDSKLSAIEASADPETRAEFQRRQDEQRLEMARRRHDEAARREAEEKRRGR